MSDAEHTQAVGSDELDTFIRRMRATKRMFFVETQPKGPDASKGASGQVGGTTAAGGIQTITANFFDNDDDAVEFYENNEVANAASVTEAKRDEIRKSNAEHRKKWTECCQREYVNRRRRFAARFPSNLSFYRWFVLVVGFLAVILFVSWPIWNVLIDMEAEEHYKILGIGSDASAAEIKKAYRALTKQWHPDLNPSCGQKCRDMMILLQRAHDVLLAKGDRSEELANKYKEALMQIRSLIVFRLYQMSFYAAEFVNTLLLAGSIPLLKQWKSVVRRTTRVGFIVLFTTLEVVHVTGFNPIVLLQVFYFCATMLRQSAALTDLQKVSKWSYIDIRRELMMFVLPSIVLHTVSYWGFASMPALSVYWWQFCVGSAYVAAHLCRFTPNLWDNFTLKKCSVTLEYLKKPDLKFSKWEFITTEIGVVVDDIFAFSSHVPSVYRLTVMLVHSLYLTQLALLPWDEPIKGKLQRRAEKLAEDKAARRVSKESGSAARRDGSEKKKTEVPLSEREAQWFANLDHEKCLWFDLATMKYVHSLQRLAGSYKTKQPTGNVQVSIVANVDCREVLLCAVSQGPSGPVVDIRERHEDPVTAQRIAREQGPGGLLFAEARAKNHQLTPDMVHARFRNAIPEPQLMGSDWFRRRLDAQMVPERRSRFGVVVLTAAAALTLWIALFCPMDMSDDTMILQQAFDPLPIPAQVNGRYTHAIPQDHLLNQGAGLLPFGRGPLALAGPDLVDSLRQLSLYQTPEEAKAASSVRAHPSQQGSKKQNTGPKKETEGHRKGKRSATR